MRPVRLRDARRAPLLDRERELRNRLDDLVSADAQFCDAGFVRTWGETDIARRSRINAAERWCDANDILLPIRSSIVARARANTPLELHEAKDISEAFKLVQISPSTVPPWSHFTSAYRIALFGAMQIKHLGFVPFLLQHDTLRTFNPETVSAMTTELVVHAANKIEIFEQMRNISIHARHKVLLDLSRAFTLEDANNVLARTFDDIADGRIM
jgi:hypothetical protein